MNRTPGEFALPTRHLPAPQVRDLPEPSFNRWAVIGPGLVASGVGLASGEFILWPYIASQVGLVFLWGAVVGLATQWFLNMEIERYTLATGETALTGFSRYWRHWGLVFALMTYFANLWPGWAASSATMFAYVFDADRRVVALAILVTAGAILTLAPVVYTALERLVIAKVVIIGGFMVIALALAIKAETWAALPDAVVTFGRFPDGLELALMMGAIAFAGAGGGQNLCQSNWIRDKGFGMGRHVPRLVSAVTGTPHRAEEPVGYVFELTEANLDRWGRWWRFANLEQALTFALVTFVTIVFTSMLAHSTLFGAQDLPTDIGFLRIEGERLAAMVGPWFGTAFWLIGAYSLFTASVGIVDYTSRLMADVLKSTYLRQRPVRESTLYFWLVWGLVGAGALVIGSGWDQPLILLVISACTGGVMMFIYSILLLRLNRRAMPEPIKVRSVRVAALVWSAAFFGALSLLTVIQQANRLLG